MSDQNKRKQIASAEVISYNQLQFETYNSQFILNQGGSLEEFTPETFKHVLKYRNILNNKLLLRNLVKPQPNSAN